MKTGAWDPETRGPALPAAVHPALSGRGFHAGAANPREAFQSKSFCLELVERRNQDRRVADRRTRSEPLPAGVEMDRRRNERRQEDRRLQRAGTFVNRESLYQEFAPLVRRLIRQYGDSPEIRQDLAGEIYYRFCYLLESYDPSRGVPLRPYLVRQLTASVYTYARHGWMRQRREVSYEEKAQVTEPTNREDPTHEWTERLAMEQVLSTLPEAITRLPKRQRHVVIWRYYEQCSFEEIASRMQVKTATARSLLRHGINNLRKCLCVD